MDARPFVFAGGTAQATFSNGDSILLTWSNPVFHSFDPLCLPSESAESAVWLADQGWYLPLHHPIVQGLHHHLFPPHKTMLGTGLAGIAAWFLRTLHADQRNGAPARHDAALTAWDEWFPRRTRGPRS